MTDAGTTKAPDPEQGGLPQAKTPTTPRRAGGIRIRRRRADAAAYDVVALVDDLLRQAAAAGASDVHFEPTGERLAVRFRLDGALTPIEELPKHLSENVVSRLKVLGGLLTYRTDIPQEGGLRDARSYGGRVLDGRLAVFPTIHGQRAVVRFFHEERGLMELGRLGLPEAALRALKRIAAGNAGVLLLTGPAGSGKSTTLAAVLRHVLRRSPGKSIVTLEDPVERRIEGATQVEIPPHGPMTFPVALRSLLRQDPEVLMIGEIRDAETAHIAVEAGLTGHLVMSTMHGGTPAAALLRLLEMGIEPYQLTSSVRAVLNQRLVRVPCERCKRRDPAGGFRATGCEGCFRTGFRGRMLIAELAEVDAQLRREILAKGDLAALERILGAGPREGLFQSGRRLVEQGLTTADELRRVCGLGDDGET
jgi:type II secretory ATPase GspE/PulE/Tfp pilus assembly ATPase PilB-like protein